MINESGEKSKMRRKQVKRNKPESPVVAAESDRSIVCEPPSPS